MSQLMFFERKKNFLLSLRPWILTEVCPFLHIFNTLFFEQNFLNDSDKSESVTKKIIFFSNAHAMSFYETKGKKTLEEFLKKKKTFKVWQFLAKKTTLATFSNKKNYFQPQTVIRNNCLKFFIFSKNLLKYSSNSKKASNIQKNL